MNKNQNDNQNPQTGNLSNQQNKTETHPINKNETSSSTKPETHPINKNETHPSSKNNLTTPNNLDKKDEKGHNEKPIISNTSKSGIITNHTNDKEIKGEKYGYPSEEDIKKSEKQQVVAEKVANSQSTTQSNLKNNINPKG